MTKYVLVEWPECQYLMNHERFDECYLVEDSAYMCPENLYCEVFKHRSEKERFIDCAAIWISKYLLSATTVEYYMSKFKKDMEELL